MSEFVYLNLMKCENLTIFHVIFQLLEVCRCSDVGRLPIPCQCGASQDSHCHDDHNLQKDL